MPASSGQPFDVRKAISDLMAEQKEEADLPVSRALADFQDEPMLGDSPESEQEPEEAELPQEQEVELPETMEFDLPEEFGGEPEVMDLPDEEPHTGFGGAQWGEEEPEYLKEMLQEFAAESANDVSEKLGVMYGDMRNEFRATLDDELSLMDRGENIL